MISHKVLLHNWSAWRSLQNLINFDGRKVQPNLLIRLFKLWDIFAGSFNFEVVFVFFSWGLFYFRRNFTRSFKSAWSRLKWVDVLGLSIIWRHLGTIGGQLLQGKELFIGRNRWNNGWDIIGFFWSDLEEASGACS